MHDTKMKEKEKYCERNFDGKFFGELCCEIVQQVTSEGSMNCFGGLPNKFYQNSIEVFENKKLLF